MPAPATPSAATRSTTTERSGSTRRPAADGERSRRRRSGRQPPPELSDPPARSSIWARRARAARGSSGKLHSAPSTTFDLDFYSNPACSNFPREFIEGETYLGSSPGYDRRQRQRDLRRDASRHDRGRRPHHRHRHRSGGNTSEFSQRIIFSISPASGPDYRRHARFNVIRHRLCRSDDDDRRAALPPTASTFVNDHQLSATMPAVRAGHVPRRRRHHARRHDRHARSRAGSPTSSTCRPGHLSTPSS